MTGTSQAYRIDFRRSSKMRIFHSTRVASSSILDRSDGGLVLQFVQRHGIRPNLLGEFLLAARQPFEPVHDFGALAVERLEQSGKKPLALVGLRRRISGEELADALLRFLHRRPPRRQPRDKVLDLRLALPGVCRRFDRRAVPHGGDRDIRHLGLHARPVGIASVGGVQNRRQSGAQYEGRRKTTSKSCHLRSSHAARRIVTRHQRCEMAMPQGSSPT